MPDDKSGYLKQVISSIRGRSISSENPVASQDTVTWELVHAESFSDFPQQVYFPSSTVVTGLIVNLEADFV